LEQHPKIWYASSMRPYAGNESWLYNPANFEWAQHIEAHWSEVKAEVDKLIKEEDDKFIAGSTLYENIDTKHGWSAILFRFWGAKVSGQFNKKCPKLASYVNGIPGLVSVSISRLAPQTTLSEHSGDTNAIMRCHLGVEIPASLPNCGFKVNGEEVSWGEGKFMMFNDAYRHSAWNSTDKQRTVLIMDVVRPEFIKSKNLICAFILTRHASYMYDKIRLIRIMPVFIKTILFAGILGLVYLFRPVYNLFKQ
jgi:aspartyl/asparaginyl beta-hydroxylase (cupin superfamily)